VLLSELLSPDRVKVPLAGRTKDELLRELVELASPTRTADVAEAILAAVRERERELSTGIGSGVAIPHAKTPFVEQLVMAAGIAPAPVDFDALDGQPVQLFFLLVGPESAAGAHIKALARISRLLRREALRSSLRSAQDARAFLQVVRDSEAV
jgi:mannitol/fructose-specific phosphotransferase system IIA component (Ntr-type)